MKAPRSSKRHIDSFDGVANGARERLPGPGVRMTGGRKGSKGAFGTRMGVMMDEWMEDGRWQWMVTVTVTVRVDGWQVG